MLLVITNMNIAQGGSIGISRCQVPPGVYEDVNAANKHKTRRTPDSKNLPQGFLKPMSDILTTEDHTLILKRYAY